MLVRFTQIDYDREMAMIATMTDDDKESQIDITRYVGNPDGESVKFALAVGDAWQKCGVSRKLMTALTDCPRPGFFAQVTTPFRGTDAIYLL